MEKAAETDATYRQQFAESSKAEEYDAVQYDPSSYSEILWKVEQEQLAELIAEFRKSHERIEYLDFAAGTGRIVSFMEDKVDRATGIEISAAMVERANQKLSQSTMICTDITADDAPIEAQYDFITTFRFILNAEPKLRLAGIKALAARLRDDSSVLVFNNHSNLVSHKLLVWPFHKLRGLSKGYQTEGNYMTNGQVHQLARDAGLEIVRTIGCGFLSSKLARLVSVERAIAIEKRLARSRLFGHFCVNQLYVTRRIR